VSKTDGVNCPGQGWCNSWETIPDPGDPSQTIEVLRSQVQAMDTDGDRIPELVCTFDGPSFSDVKVRKWNGQSLTPPQLLQANWCRTTVQGGDFDGDGKLELVCESGAVLSAGPPNVVPDLMLEAENGIGGKTSAVYQPSSVFGCNKPPVRQVVTSMTTDDGRGGMSTTSYTYCGGRSDPAEGTFLGYGQVQTTLPCLEGESACPVTTTFLSQELRSLGRPTLVRRADGSGSVLQETRTFFHPQQGLLPRQALVKEVRTTDVGPAGATKTTAVSYLYDPYANATRQTSHGKVTPGGVEIPGDETWTDVTYWPADLGRYIVGLVQYRKVYEQQENGSVLLKSAEMAYSAAGDLTSLKTTVLPGSAVLERTMTYDDVTGNLTWVRSELGAETTLSYGADGLHPQTVTNPDGMVTTEWHPLCDAPTQVSDLNGVTTTTGYDSLCRAVRTDAPEGAFTERHYEMLGNPNAQHVRVETPGSSGNDWTKEYFDGLGRTYRTEKRGPSYEELIRTERTYNPRGGLAWETAPCYEGASPDVTAYTYDPFDRVLTIRQPDGTQTTKSYGLWKETTTDPKGKAVTVQGTTKSSVRTTTINGELVTTTQQFDMLGRRTGLQDTKGNAWNWTYDALDRVLQQADPDSGVRTYVYDDRDRTQTETDAEGHVLTLAYDTLGRVVSKTSGVGTSTFRYSEARGSYANRGRLTTVLSPGTTPGVTNTLTMDYDALGRVRKQWRSIPEAGFTGAVIRDYDSFGFLSTMTYPDSDAIGPMSYDAAGRLTSVPGILLDVTYDAAGRPLEQRNANGTVTTRTYVPHRGVLDTLVTTHPNTGTIQSLDYGYDPDLPLVTSVSGEPADSWSYAYDDAYRLVWSTNPGGHNVPPDVQTFQYDSLGRLTSNSRVGEYVYPPPGSPRPHAPISVGGDAYAYSPNGNLALGGGRNIFWDAENRIVAIGKTTTFSYDAFGERLLKTSSQATSVYPFGDDYEVTNGVVTKYISVDGLGVIAKRVTGGSNPGTYWIHTDRLGSIHRETNAAGALVLGRRYRAYGETLSQSGTQPESRGWIDQRNDAETGLTYLHARYFDPKLGTFLSPDPIGVAGGLNQYGYGFGNPVGWTDRSGLASQVCYITPPGSAGCGTNPSCTNPAPNVQCWTTDEHVNVPMPAGESLPPPPPNTGIPEGSPVPTGPDGTNPGNPGSTQGNPNCTGANCVPPEDPPATTGATVPPPIVPPEVGKLGVKAISSFGLDLLGTLLGAGAERMSCGGARQAVHAAAGVIAFGGAVEGTGYAIGGGLAAFGPVPAVSQVAGVTAVAMGSYLARQGLVVSHAQYLQATRQAGACAP
jgi:RHS repeat-associated protein